MNQNYNPNERLLRVKEVAGYFGVAVSTVWLWNKQGKIPKPFKLTPSTTVWKNSDIQAHIQKMIEENLPKNEPVPQVKGQKQNVRKETPEAKEDSTTKTVADKTAKVKTRRRSARFKATSGDTSAGGE